MFSRAELDLALAQDIGVSPTFLTSDMDVRSAALCQLRGSFVKKFQDEVSPTADSKCLEKFLESNVKCSRLGFTFDSSQEEQVFGEMCNILENFFNPEGLPLLSLTAISSGFGVGPGANLKAKEYNFYTKLFDSPLTSTSQILYDYYRRAISCNPTWYAAEKARRASYGSEIVEGSRLSFVPKTFEVSRSICTEPTLNMLFQKGIGRLIERRLREVFHISLDKQPDLNKEMAAEGSIDGNCCTIDLSSASDTISLALLRKLLPPQVFRWLELTRSPVTVLPNGTRVELEMVSSMGNGFTFPLETAIFSCLVCACYRVLGIRAKWGVFGDDIIVHRSAYHFVCRCLEKCGFEVNGSKSFFSGHFRESCGGDYWKGHDVRGLYCKSTRTLSDVTSLLNRIIEHEGKYGIDLECTRNLLKPALKGRVFTVPWIAGFTEGVRVPLDRHTYNPRNSRAKQYCPVAYHGSVPYYARVPRSVSFDIGNDEKANPEYSAVGRVLDVDSNSQLGSNMRIASKRFVSDRSSSGQGRNLETFQQVSVPPYEGYRYNPDGVLVAAIGGFLRDGRFELVKKQLNEPKKTHVVIRHTSIWEPNYPGQQDGRAAAWLDAARRLNF